MDDNEWYKQWDYQKDFKIGPGNNKRPLRKARKLDEMERAAERAALEKLIAQAKDDGVENPYHTASSQQEILRVASGEPNEQHYYPGKDPYASPEFRTVANNVLNQTGAYGYRNRPKEMGEVEDMFKRLGFQGLDSRMGGLGQKELAKMSMNLAKDDEEAYLNQLDAEERRNNPGLYKRSGGNKKGK